MHLLWISPLLQFVSILTSLCIFSSAGPTQLSPIKSAANPEIDLNVRSYLPHNLPALPETQLISKRAGFSYGVWGNGWTSRSNIYAALVPVLPAAAKLSVFYANLFQLSSSFPPSLSASTPTMLNGMPAQMAQFQYGGFELRFFSMTTIIPWSFVRTVAASLKGRTVFGFTGLHGTVFVHEAAGLAVFVTLTAAGLPGSAP